MSKKKLYIICGAISAFIFSISTCYAYNSLGNKVNTVCESSGIVPFTGSCSLCHLSDYGDKTAAKTASKGSNSTIVNFFCPAPTPSCTDNDRDTFAIEGGECGAVDCNDSQVAINPGAAENCTDSFDNDCDGLIDITDPDAVSCPPVCTDNDGDNYSIEGGECGPVDCDDTNATVSPGLAEICGDELDNTCNDVVDEGCVIEPICTDNDGDSYAVEGGECGLVDCDDTDADVNPGAVEDCTDSIDNNCNGLVDTLDETAENCPLACTDTDMDNYAVDGGICGPIDCNDIDDAVSPGSEEICDDGIDNDCDGTVDEGCDPACPDDDGDGFLDAACGGTDCNDTDAGMNPAIAEMCGNGIDENCNGSSDDECLSCPDGGLLIIKKTKYDFEKKRLYVKGKSHVNTVITLTNPLTGDVLAENINVKGGKWRVKVRNLAHSDAPETVEAMNSDGCYADKEVKMENRPEPKEDDDEDDDDDDGDDDEDECDKKRSLRKWRSWRR